MQLLFILIHEEIDNIHYSSSKLIIFIPLLKQSQVHISHIPYIFTGIHSANIDAAYSDQGAQCIWMGTSHRNILSSG